MEDLPGLKVFGNNYPSAKKILVGGDGIPVEEFLLTRDPRKPVTNSDQLILSLGATTLLVDAVLNGYE
jgi:hypothetical protein